MTRKQHYIPQILLRNFSENGKTVQWVDKKDASLLLATNKNLTVPISSQAYKKNLYEADGETANLIERELSQIEHEVSILINNKIKSSEELTSNEQSLLVAFMVLQMFRMPALMERLMTLAKQACPEYNSDTVVKMHTLFPRLEVENRVLWKWAYSRLVDGKHLVVYESQKPFILGDFPTGIILFPFGDERGQLYLPVTPYRCLTLLPETTETYMKVSDRWVDLLNMDTLNRCERGYYTI